jgi:hypothetical protein
MTPSVTLAEGFVLLDSEGVVLGSVQERGEQEVSRRKKTLF